jgi:tetratricopeptide (TPR) repeat protein
MNAKLNKLSIDRGHLTHIGARYIPALFIALALMFSLSVSPTMAQSGFTLYGDVKVDETKADGKAPLSLSIILYTLGGNVVGRQTVPSGGRYRFTNLRSSEYDLAVEIETSEIARVRVSVGGTPGADQRQDLEFEWKGGTAGVRNKPATISAGDIYKRSSSNESTFRKAQEAVDKKKYSDAVTLFRQLLDNDAADFQAWTELGTVYLLQEKHDDAEKAYLKAIEIRPSFSLPLVNLGRLLVLQKKFDAATEPLLRALELQPTSAEINYLLGDAYLQNKKGSKAVGYMNEAAKLGKHEAHLRLASLYNLAGMKDKAAIEYEEFLKKTPNYPDRKKLEAYIATNKKAQ